MTLPYLLRLICVCLASFFVVNLALSLFVLVMASWAIRLSAGIAARSAATFIFGLRLFPTALALATVAALCLPSFLSFEPQLGRENASLPFLFIAALGGIAWAISIARTARALVLSRARMNRCSSRL